LDFWDLSGLLDQTAARPQAVRLKARAVFPISLASFLLDWLNAAYSA
jgi:hypothetical protein